MLYTELYVLDGKIPRKVDNLFEWAETMHKQNNIVAKTTIQDVTVSTIFLGMDYSHYFEHGPPVLFETAIFGGDHNGYQKRYSTWEAAEEGHHRACAMVVEA